MTEFNLNDQVVLNKCADAQVYEIDEQDGFVVKLRYKCGEKYSYTETDVCRIMKPSKDQLLNHAK